MADIEAGRPAESGDAAVAAAGGLAEAWRLRAAARRDRQEWPFALVALGVVVLLAVPFYVGGRPATALDVAIDPNGGVSYRLGMPLGLLSRIGPWDTVLGAWAGLYWVVALVAAGVLTAVHYRRSARRRGIAGPVWPVTAAGLALLVALVLVAPRVLALAVRGFTPLLVVALGLVVLAWTERSASLAVVAGCFLAVSVLANLYDVVNLVYRLGLPASGWFDQLPSLLLPALVLLVPGVVAAVRRRSARAGAAR